MALADSPKILHVAKFLQLERNVQNIFDEMERLYHLVGKQDKKLKEMHESSMSFVSQAELLAVVSGRKSQPIKSVELYQNDGNFSIISSKIDDISATIKDLKASTYNLESDSKYVHNINGQVWIIPFLYK
jgi:hypothetical protein